MADPAPTDADVTVDKRVPRAVRVFVPTALLLLIGILILQALAYGIGFVLDPEGNVGEFGYDVPDQVDALTVELVRVIGVAMVGAATLLALSAILIWRGDPAGTYVALVIGAIYIGVSLLAANAGSWWDAGFYGITGLALIALSAAVRWLQRLPEGRVST